MGYSIQDKSESSEGNTLEKNFTAEVAEFAEGKYYLCILCGLGVLCGKNLLLIRLISEIRGYNRS
jgi:hypothetical protein